MSRRIISALLLAGCTHPSSAVVATPPPPCAPLPTPTAIVVAEPKPGELNELFELHDTPALWAPCPEDAAAAAYRAALGPRVGELTPRALVERQRAVFTEQQFPDEYANATVIARGQAGSIHRPSCLERQLFAHQAAQFPLVEHPTEFGAWILRSHDQRVRVYFSSQDRVGQRLRRELNDRVAEDHAHGWHVVAHLHSHPFLLGRVVGDRMWTRADTIADVAGGLAPSTADAQLWKNFADAVALEEGWITNGLDTIHVPSAAFPLLRGAH